MTPDRDRLRALAEAATPVPWRTEYSLIAALRAETGGARLGAVSIPCAWLEGADR